MLDNELLQQLKVYFSSLSGETTFSYSQSDHPDQKDLVDILSSVVSSSSKLKMISTESKASIPQFTLLYNGTPSGIFFKGIPTGHEFSSLVLAILNLDKKGKFPDEGIQNRIKNLQGPIRLQTFISLTCENCPNVVQILNLMSCIHEDFQHTMVDGGYVQDEINRLGIQGVPSVISEGKLIHSGKVELLDLLSTLEKHFGMKSTEPTTQTTDLGTYDVAIVGGGPAGSASAIYAARKGLKTAIIAEKIGGQVRDTKGIENLISVLYTEGPTLAAQLNEHMANYPISIFEHRRVQNIGKEKMKKIELQGGEVIYAKAVIITTGAKWRELGIPGEKEYIGRGVAFCPHCDGPYYKGRPVAVVGGGNSGIEAAIDLANIVERVTVIEFAPTLKADKVLLDKLNSLKNVSVITNAKTTQIIGDGQKVVAIEYEDRKNSEKLRLALDGVFVQIGLIPNSKFLNNIVEMTPAGEIVVDIKGRTSVTGIYAAGDVTTVPYKQIIIAMGEGAKAGLAAFEDLMFGLV